MFTKNYYVMQALNNHVVLNSLTSPNGIAWEEKLGRLTHLNGESVPFANITLFPTINDQYDMLRRGAIYNLNFAHSITLIVGSSNEAENINDYSLKTETTDLTEVVETTATNITDIGYDENGGTKILITKSFTNNTDSPITIREIGLIKKYYVVNSQQSNNIIEAGNFLIARNVLDNPITVEPGNTVTVSMTLEL